MNSKRNKLNSVGTLFVSAAFLLTGCVAVTHQPDYVVGHYTYYAQSPAYYPGHGYQYRPARPIQPPRPQPPKPQPPRPQPPKPQPPKNQPSKPQPGKPAPPQNPARPGDRPGRP